MDTDERERRQKQIREKDLTEHAVDVDPFEQFKTWFQDAQDCGVVEADAMCLATADSEGHPSARFVLLKGYDSRGFVWYTNYESRKAGELDANPSAALVFWWKELGRSVRIEGTTCRVASEESDEYFASRPVGSRISASVSQQSRPVSTRKELEERSAEFRESLEHRCGRSFQPSDSADESTKARATNGGERTPALPAAVSIARWPVQEPRVDSPRVQSAAAASAPRRTAPFCALPPIHPGATAVTEV